MNFYVNSNLAKHYGKAGSTNTGAGVERVSYGPFTNLAAAEEWVRDRGVLWYTVTNEPEGRVINVATG